MTGNASEVRIENLGKAFGEQPAVRGVSLHVAKGDFFTLLGPSGCGKTTLLRMIAGFTAPDEGEIRIDGRRVNEIPPWDRGIGMVFQNYALWPHMSVFENVAFGLKERRTPRPAIREKVREALRTAGLEGLEDRRPSQLSGGQQQRVALARTLVTEPGLLLLDEPLSNLDAKLRVQMRGELLRLQREAGVTTIYVTHDQEEALALSTRIAVMSRGEVVQEGTPKEIYETPKTRTTADFVGTSNVMAVTVASVDGEYARLVSGGIEDPVVSWGPSFETPPSPGEPLLLSVRPESIRVAGPAEVPECNRIPGRIAASTYLGPMTQYEVEIEPAGAIRFRSLNSRRFPLLRPGARVLLTFSPHDAVLLPPEGGGHPSPPTEHAPYYARS